MINHRSSTSDLFLRQRDLPLSLLPKSLFNSTSPNLKLAFLVNMIFFLFFFLMCFNLKYWTGWTPSCRLHGWRELLWHEPNWVPVSIIAPNTGHYHRLCVDLTSCTQYVSSVVEHGTSTLPDLIFSYFCGWAVSPRVQPLTVHLMSKVSNRQSPLDQSV